MAWTKITRRHYRREGLRYESDTTDAEWFVMEPLLPPASALGRPRATDMRTVINAILYIASTGYQYSHAHGMAVPRLTRSRRNNFRKTSLAEGWKASSRMTARAKRYRVETAASTHYR